MLIEDLSISVLLPLLLRTSSRNSLEKLYFALDSVLSQEYPAAFEVIIVDGSPFEVRKFLDEAPLYSDSAIKWYRPHRNYGLTHALNSGLLNACYPFIARIDADDSWRPGKIKEQMKWFEDDSDLTIVGTGMAVNDLTRGISEDHIRQGTWHGILKFFVEIGCPFPHGSIVAKKDIFMLLGGYPEDVMSRKCEDFALWGTWLRFFKPGMIEKVLFDYNFTSESKSSINSQQLRTASGMIQNKFIQLQIASSLPDLLESLAALLSISIMETGKICFLMWKYLLRMILPKKALPILRLILPDRIILEIKTYRDNCVWSNKRFTSSCNHQEQEIEDPVIVQVIS
ncbi:MAG: glycosyltransferase [Deltaproteobacteria bacterium]|nr:glycosyltransferase [Deltaproteobacteria bacterium]